jgi:hypothetical protein
MKETIVGFVRDWGAEPCLDNLDFDSAIRLRREIIAGNSYTLGKVDRRDGSVKIEIFLQEKETRQYDVQEE